MAKINEESLMGESKADINISNESLVINHFETTNQDVVSYFAGLKSEQVHSMFETALKVGVLSLRSANLTEKIDYVQKEFNLLSEKYSKKLEETMQGIGEQFEQAFGEEGSFSKVISDHFGEDGKIVKQIFDPTVEGTPLCKLKAEFRSDIQGLETRLGISQAVEEERQKTTLKGFSFEEFVESVFSDIAKQNSDILERTTTIPGKIKNSKKGDFVFSLSGKPDKRIVFETKDIGGISAPEIQRTLDEAMKNREAGYGVMLVKYVESLPKSVGWFNEYNGNQLVCALASQENEGDELHSELIQIAYRWAKAKLLLEAAREAKVDTVKLKEKVDSITTKVGSLSTIRTQCTNVEKASSTIRSNVDTIEREIKDDLNALLLLITTNGANA